MPDTGTPLKYHAPTSVPTSVSPGFIDKLRTALPCLLLSLPAELRNEIYTYVLIKREGTYIFRSGHQAPKPLSEWLQASGPVQTRRPPVRCPRVSSRRVKNSPHRLALLATCRQIYDEARLLPFSVNTFEFTTPGLQLIISALQPAQRMALTKIYFTDPHFSQVRNFLDDLKSCGITSLAELLPNAREVRVRCWTGLQYLPLKKFKRFVERADAMMGWLGGDVELVERHKRYWPIEIRWNRAVRR